MGQATVSLIAQVPKLLDSLCRGYGADEDSE
jgi:hypothetical protein